MRAKPDKVQPFIFGLSIDQDEIGLDVAIPVIFPVTGQGVVVVTLRQWLIAGKQGNHGQEILVQGLAVLAFFLTLVVALEGTGPPDRPHHGLLTIRLRTCIYGGDLRFHSG